MVKNLEEITKIINEHKLFLTEKFKVKSVRVFGSYIRGEQKEESDIDMLVEFFSTIDLFDFIELNHHISNNTDSFYN